MKPLSFSMEVVRHLNKKLNKPFTKDELLEALKKEYQNIIIKKWREYYDCPFSFFCKRRTVFFDVKINNFLVTLILKTNNGKTWRLIA